MRNPWADMLDAETPAYFAEISFEREEGALVIFGGANENYLYADGSVPVAAFAFNKALWEIAGKPDKIRVGFIGVG